MTLLNQLSALVAMPLMMAAPPADSGAAPAGPMGVLGQMVPFIAIFVVVYLMVLRPQSKKQQEHSSMLNALKKDDEIITTSGMWGRIIGLEDRIATIEIADKVKIRILRDRIAGLWSSEAVSTPATRK